MMKKTNEKGITLIALVVTIIVMLILAGIVITGGKYSLNKERENKLITELDMVSHAVLQRYTKASLTNEKYPGVQLTDDEYNEYNNFLQSKLETFANSDYKNYYKLTKDNQGLEKLGINDSTDEYIVNYETGEVFNITTKVTDSGQLLYIRVGK